MPKIFISYRRAEAEYAAGSLGRELRRHFGESQVFRDKEDIAGGVSWKQHVLNEIDRDSALLVLIGREWSQARDARGGRRLHNPDDPIRLEIADGIRDQATLIPVLLENAQMPAVSELPADLAPIAELNALKLRDGDWDADVAKIVKTLEKAGLKPAAGTKPEPDPKPAVVKRSAKAIWSLAIAALVAIGYAEGFDREATVGALIFSLGALALAGFAFYDIKLNAARGKGLAILGVSASAVLSLILLNDLMTPDSPVPVAQAPDPTPPAETPPPAPPVAPAAPVQALAPAAPPPAEAPVASPESKPVPLTPKAVAEEKPSAKTVNVAGQWHDEEEGTLVLFTQDGGNVRFVATEAGLAVEGRGTISGPDIAMTLYMANVAIGQSSMRVSNDGRRIQGRMNVNGDVSDFTFIR